MTKKCRHYHTIYSGADQTSQCVDCGKKGGPGESLSEPFSYEPFDKGRPTPDRLDEIREHFESERWLWGIGRADVHPAIRDLLNEIRALRDERCAQAA